MTLLVIVPLLMCLVAAAALAYALRGRRVDDHPLCRKCRFDLIGSPPGADRCSECGADLNRKHAVRIGHRAKRGRLVAAALPVLLLCLGWLGVVAWVKAKRVDLNRHKPAAWLLRETRAGDAAAGDAALAELTRRLADRTLSDGHTAHLIELALRVQADERRPWTQAWGDVIAAARDAGRMPHEKWVLYAHQGAAPRLRARPTFRRGGLLVFTIDRHEPRVSPKHSFAVNAEMTEVRLGDVVVETYKQRPYEQPSFVYRGEPVAGLLTRLCPLPPDAAALADGEQPLRVRARISISDMSESGIRPAPFFQQSVELSVPVRVLPAGEPAVKMNVDPSLAAAVQKSLAADPLRSDPTAARATVHAIRPPVGLAFRVFLRSGEREWDIKDHLAFSPHVPESDGIWALAGTLAAFDETAISRVDIVLRPSPERAEATLHLMEIWGGEVVLKDVPVSREE